MALRASQNAGVPRLRCASLGMTIQWAKTMSLDGGCRGMVAFVCEGESDLCGGEEEKEDAAQSGLASGRVVPLLDGMDVASDATGADGERGDAEREGEIGVGGAEALFGGEVEVAVDGTEEGEKGRVVGQGGGGTVADGLDLKRGWDGGGGERGDGLVEDAME